MSKTVFPFAAVLLLAFATLTVFKASAGISPNIIYVPNDYARIQWAIDNATKGDTVIVSSGIYFEHLTIDKSLILQGENRNTIIDGDGTCHVITVIADNVSVSGFTIQNSSPNFGDSGIRLLNSKKCNISYNVIIQNGHGIWIDCNSDSNLIAWNKVSHNLVGMGIVNCSNNIITNNYICSNTLCGMGLVNTSNNILTNNIAKNNEYGIYLSNSTNFTIAGNTLVNNWRGIYLSNSNSNTIFHNNIINNTCQSVVINSKSTWDSNFEGNYWSDYNGTDFYSGPYQNQTGSDGIGDTPYIIDAYNRDRYPLMKPWTLLGDLNIDGAIDMRDLAIFGKAFGSYQGHPRWNPAADINDDGKVNMFDGVLIASSFGKRLWHTNGN